MLAKTGSHAPQTKNDEQVIEYSSGDGKPMAETKFQYIPMAYMVTSLDDWFSNNGDVFVAGSMLVYYVEGDNSASVAPNVFVVFGANGNHPRRTWQVWEEANKVPSFVMEVAAASTWEQDANEKRKIYARMQVQEYWRFDPTGEYFHELGLPILVGERLVGDRYQRMDVTELDGELRGHSDVLGLDLRVLPDKAFRFYDPENGTWLLNQSELRVEREGRLAEQKELLGELEGRLAAEAEVQRLREQIARRTLRE